MATSPTVLVVAAIAFAVACSSSCSSVLLNYASKNRNPPPSASTVAPSAPATAPTTAPRPAQPGENRIGAGVINPADRTLPPGGGTGNTVRTASSYHPDFSTNACGMKPDPSGNNTAIGAALCAKLGVPVTGPNSPTCGRKLIVTNERTKESVTVTVLDRRGDGEGLGLDMQTEAFNRIDGDKEGVKTGKHANLSVRWAS